MSSRVRQIEATYAGPAPAPAVNHCLLVETDSAGLVLVETGMGLGDVRDPDGTLGADWVAMAQPLLDEDETAIRQVARLGYAPADVRHIILTHLDVDHCGGLPDFPRAEVHVLAAELAAAVAEAPSFRYRDIVQTTSEVHRDLRLGTQARLRELVRDHGDEVSVFSAHDPWEFNRYR